MDTLFYLGIILVLGACVERLAPWLHMPKVVGYLLLGLVIGPEVLGIIPQSFVENAQIVTDLALSIIAVLVGATLKFSFLRSSLSEIVKITLFQSLSTFAIVAAGFYLLGEHAGIGVTHMAVIALLLGGIATATDTAAPLSLVKELGANGRFTSTFLAVVALDDAVSLLMFIIALSIAGTLLGQPRLGAFFALACPL
jgi:NhaP-type Na+/H+ and K+/H+ antiporters